MTEPEVPVPAVMRGYHQALRHDLPTLASAKNTPEGATRVFVHALKTLCTPTQWTQYLPVASAAATPDIWASIVAEVPSLEPVLAAH